MKFAHFSLSDQTLNQNHKAKQKNRFDHIVTFSMDNKGMQNTDDDDGGNKRTLLQFTVFFHGLFSLSVHRYIKENHVSVPGDN